jgi:phosphonate transport system substrate-binding protein
MVRFLLVLFALAGLAAQPAAAQSLRIGVAPHSSARAVLELYQPLRERMEAELAQPVEIRTAPDFTEFARRALAGEYDIAITTGHQARLLQTDAGFLPLLTYTAPFRAVVVVAKGSAVRHAVDLSGKTVIGLSPTSLVTQWGLHWLARNKVTDARVRHVSAADSVARLILGGEAAAGFMSSANVMGLAPEMRDQLDYAVQSEPMLGRVYMLNPALANRRPDILAALGHFAASESGQRYFAATKLDGYRPIAPGELEAMDPYAAEVRAQLAAPPG